MKNFWIKLAFAIWMAWFLTMTQSCVSSNPAARYARTHSDKEFTSWKDLNRKMDKAEKAKPKEHQKRNNY